MYFMGNLKRVIHLAYFVDYLQAAAPFLVDGFRSQARWNMA